jgi:light-harvesting complex 1 beta chain
MADRDERTGTLSGLTEAEAREFHRIFMTSFVIFTLIAIAAHVLVWMWRPWLPGVHGYSELQTGAHYAQALVSQYIA